MSHSKDRAHRAHECAGEKGIGTLPPPSPHPRTRARRISNVRGLDDNAAAALAALRRGLLLALLLRELRVDLADQVDEDVVDVDLLARRRLEERDA